jgi:pentatricopeptide repeat protein
LGPDKWPAENTPQVGLWLYLSTRKDSEVASAFERMVHKNKATVTSRLALRFVDRFVRLGDVDYALQALRIAWFVEKERTPQYTRQVIERCKNLLELDEIIEIDGAYQFRILGEMLDMGIIPNRDMFNVTMENAVRLGEPGLAFDIYKYMLSRGRPPNAHTFVVLLEDAIERRDVEMTQYVLRQITSDQSIDKPEYVVSKVLHAIHCFEMEAPENPEPWERLDRFHDMLQIYRRFHDERPLIDLGIIRPDNENPELTDTSEKMRPSLHTLTVMISAYVRSQTETNLIRELLSRFIQLVSKGHPDIAPLAETDHVYNAFLMGMRPHPSMLNDGVNVLATMLTPLPETAVLQDGSQRPVQHARPTVQTWAILLSAFLTHRQPQSAVKIRETMLKHGYQFNQPTWNILIRGFARLQMIEETAASLVMMDRENFAPNERTERALGVIRNQTRLRAVLDQLTGAGDRDYDGGSAGVDDYLHSRAKDFESVPDERNWEVEDDDWRERM